MSKTVVSLNTGLEDAETVTVAFLVAVGAAEQGRPATSIRQGSRPTPRSAAPYRCGSGSATTQ
jgi:hypothetical protein